MKTSDLSISHSVYYDQDSIQTIAEEWGIDADERGLTGVAAKIENGESSEVFFSESASPYLLDAKWHPVEYYLPAVPQMKLMENRDNWVIANINDTVLCFSYETLVAYKLRTGAIYIRGQFFSTTTSKHINQFISWCRETDTNKIHKVNEVEFLSMIGWK